MPAGVVRLPVRAIEGSSPGLAKRLIRKFVRRPLARMYLCLFASVRRATAWSCESLMEEQDEAAGSYRGSVPEHAASGARIYDFARAVERREKRLMEG